MTLDYEFNVIRGNRHYHREISVRDARSFPLIFLLPNLRPWTGEGIG